MKSAEGFQVVSNIKTNAIRSVKWTALGEIASRSIQPITTLILARLLTPTDFGLVGVAMIVISLAQIFQDFGLGKTLIQRQTEINKSSNVIFWTNLTFSFFLYLILFVIAPLLSEFFHEPKVTKVLRVLCLQIVLVSLVSVHQALFQRQFQFKQLFLIRLFSATIPGVVSIPLAFYNIGVWALVFGTLIGALFQVFLYWRLSPWRPRFNYDYQLAKKLLGFSSWVALEALLGWLLMCGDSIILGHFLGVKELGIYRTGVIFVMLVFGTFLSHFTPIAFSAFSRLQSNLDELKQTFLKIMKIICFVSFPIGIGFVIFAKQGSSIIFEEKWNGIEIVIAIIGMKDAITWFVGLNPEIYRAIGRPDINSKLLFVALIYYIPIYIFAAPYGLLTFCFARFAVAIVSMGLHFFVANKILKLPFTYLYSCVRVPFISGLIIAIVIYPLTNVSGDFVGMLGLFKLIGIIILGGIIYISVSWLVEKEFVKQTFKLAKESIT
jgi:PST family polysaccharide transporter